MKWVRFSRYAYEYDGWLVHCLVHLNISGRWYWSVRKNLIDLSVRQGWTLSLSDAMDQCQKECEEAVLAELERIREPRPENIEDIPRITGKQRDMEMKTRQNQLGALRGMLPPKGTK